MQLLGKTMKEEWSATGMLKLVRFGFERTRRWARQRTEGKNFACCEHTRAE